MKIIRFVQNIIIPDQSTISRVKCLKLRGFLVSFSANSNSSTIKLTAFGGAFLATEGTESTES